jgi:tetratricopeptide (TPR) repeat protein
VKSFSIPKGGKFQWETDAAGEFAGQLSVAENLVTSHHLVLTQSNWDPAGAKATAVVLVDRRTGKLTWDQTLANDPTLNVDGTHASYTLQLFDGGVTVSEARKRTSYVSSEGESASNDAKALNEKYQKNPEDAELALRWARAQYDQGEHELALNALVKVLAAGPADDKFAQVYDVFAKMRRDHAIKSKPTLKFAKLDKAPKLDGNLEDWKNAAEQKFDSWRDIYLSSEQVPGAAAHKTAWKGASDLSVSFRGGYDDKNLYILLVVKDDTHKNEQAEAQLIDLGDSALLMFDANNDGGVAFRGEEFSLGGGLTKAGKPVGWRWVEHGKFLTGRTPIESGVFAARNDGEKTTTYQFALPLESLSLKAEPGKQFGFSFAVVDQDQDDGSPEKAVASSPGVLSPPEPRLFSKGEFSK